MPPTRDSQLDRTAVARYLGYAWVGQVNKMLTRSRARQAQGKTRNMFPEPDGRVGRSPWWWKSTIERYDREERLHRGEPPRPEPGQQAHAATRRVSEL